MPELLMYACFACGLPGSGCPDCVVTVRVDPHTNLPIDVALVDGQPVPVQPTEEAKARSQQAPICDNCVKARNQRHPATEAWMTADERHRRFHH